MGKILTETHIRLINGGSSVGVMRILADEVTNDDEEVIGIVPQFFDQLEINHHDQIELIVIDNMHNRKQCTDITADGIINLPREFGHSTKYSKF